MGKVVFVGGIHGVGKTTFCNKLTEIYNGSLKHLSASEIIKKYKNYAFKEFEHKKVKDIDINQKLLIEGLKKEREKDNILLDGHFVLLDEKGNIKRIGIETYMALQVNGIILLLDKPKEIIKRLNIRAPNHSFTINLLETMQDEELSWAKEVAKILKLPFKEINFNQCNTYEDCLKESINFISAYIND
ncbi:ATP-binding protein [Nitrosophilus labii]|uniref:ATP-binding protein n=1 Tax=Nitrosophilus labii TaxID=2706014 RepID=UPI001656C007|nr:ATP-binding protein [Nitrosophilus labii]